MLIASQKSLKMRTTATVVVVFLVIIFVHTFMGVFAPIFGKWGEPIFGTLSGNMPEMSGVVEEDVRLLDIVMFVATVLLGIFLIRSVSREAKQRFKLESMAAELKDLNANLDSKVKEQTKELRENNRHLQSLMAAKTEFISVAAHELRTPLTAIKWIVQLLHKDAGSLPASHAEQVGKLNEIVNKMVTMVGDILNVSRIEEGRFGSKLKKQDLLPLLQSVFSAVAVNAQAKKIKLTKNIPASLPLIFFDEENLKLSLENIISNAVKYTPAGGEVSVAVAVTSKNLTITVADTGIGISAADQTRLFDKFFRANNALKHDTEGTGLGLYIARNIIQAHSGKIAFTSELDKGTTFTVTLPVAKGKR